MPTSLLWYNIIPLKKILSILITMSSLTSFTFDCVPFCQTYDLYSKVSTDQAVVRQRKLRKQVLQLRTELSQTSSQDQFAKWAKIRRKCDSATDSLEKTSKGARLAVPGTFYNVYLTCLCSQIQK
jgi:hypothetical protein